MFLSFFCTLPFISGNGGGGGGGGGTAVNYVALRTPTAKVINRLFHSVRKPKSKAIYFETNDNTRSAVAAFSFMLCGCAVHSPTPENKRTFSSNFAFYNKSNWWRTVRFLLII